jgi:DNA repair protein SbcC/Rad50
MNIKLQKIKIENFKGLKRFTSEFGGEGSTIKGENGTGKTTVYDAFLWLLFGKDSTGRKDFSVRPLDAENQPIKGLVTSVEVDIVIDGATVALKKENRENVVKGQLRGYETSCWINEVPKKVGEYSEYIAQLVSEDTFKLLTDVHFFNEKLHWKDRRKALLNIAGDISAPEGFDELLSILNGRTVEEYKKVLVEQKKKLVKERDEITPRIDELQKSLTAYADSNIAMVQADRDKVKSEIEALDQTRQVILSQEQERQKMIEAVNRLKSQLLTRKAELENDTSGIVKLLEEKSTIEQGVAKCERAAAELNVQIETERRFLQNDKRELEDCIKKIETVRIDYEKTEKALSADIDDTCFACGQKLPADKTNEAKKKQAQARKAALDEITDRGIAIRKDIDNAKKSISANEAKIQALTQELEKALVKVEECLTYKADRFAEIDACIKNRPAPDVKQDAKWQQITKDIAVAEKTLGNPSSERLSDIEIERKRLQGELEAYNQSLSQADSNKRNTARIKELEADEKRLAQHIADNERMSAMIAEYKAAESSAIEDAVNGRFRHVNFRLFKELLNGSLEEDCEAMLNGVPYSDMSCGQKIMVGVDIINVLSEHYDLLACLFIDNAESLTLPIAAKSQVIRLVADPGKKEITVTQEEADKTAKKAS